MQYFRSPIQCARSIMSVRDNPASAIYMMTFEWANARLSERRITVLFACAMSGGIAGCLSWLYATSCDVMKSKIQANVLASEQVSVRYDYS